MNDEMEKFQPFDSFSAVYKILVWTGYYKLLNNPTSGYKRIFHQIYRHLVLVLTFIYALQHLIFAALNRHNSDKLMDGLMIGIPQTNLAMKVFTVYFHTSRMERLNIFLRDDPTFRASDISGQSILRQNKEEMQRVNRLMTMSIVASATLWPCSYFVRRYNDPKEVVPSYVPFATDTWAKFSFSVLLESGPIFWIGFGHIAVDTLISTYYAHGQTQVRIIKHQLESFLGTEKKRFYLKSYFQYKDLVDENVQKQFIRIVIRYEKLVWYIKEIDAIFNVALSYQFLSSIFVVCTVVYSMTVISMTSFPFLFLLILICVLLAQVLLYCYFGNRLEFESRSIVTSLYTSDWLSLSPLFRRQIVIAMIRWSRPIQPRVCHIIPLSLSTFLTIVKSSYSLYTMLVATKSNEA